jgi:hypothetical protein
MHEGETPEARSAAARKAAAVRWARKGAHAEQAAKMKAAWRGVKKQQNGGEKQDVRRCP